MSEHPRLIHIDTQNQSPSADAEHVPTVGILMSTYNGVRYLKEQVDSIAAQEGVSVVMFVRDDGSSDNTLQVLRHLSSSTRGCITEWHIFYGDNLGFLGSFEYLLASAHDCDYYAFCDQDDVWLPGKLLCATKTMPSPDNPALYASSVSIVDEGLNPVGENRFPGFVYSIPSEFVRNRLAGHTMVWSNALQARISVIGALPCWSHDLHLIIIALLSEAPLYLDEASYVLHRRLATSVTAGGSGLHKRIAHEANRVWNKDHKANRPELARAILEAPSVALTTSDLRFLRACADRDRVGLLSNSSLDCGLALGNLEARISVLLGRF